MTIRRGRSQHTAARATNRRSRSIRTGALAILMCTATLATACAPTQSSSPNAAPPTTVPGPNKVGGTTSGPADGAPIEGGKIVFGIDAEPEGLNPARYALAQAGHTVASAVFEPLATLDENGQPVPYLATAIDPSADLMTWTITLPTGVKFHDGTPLDADAVVTVLDSYRTSALVGTAFFMVDSFAKKDATHVEVKMNRKVANFLALMSTQAGYIVAPAMLTNTDLAKQPVGTGPFMFDRHEEGKLWSFKKNPDYRQKGLPHLDSIDFVPLPDPVDRNDRLRTNDIDVVMTYTGPQVVELRAADKWKIAENQHGDKSYLTLNTTKAPFDNPIARRAIARATDAAAWRKEVGANIVLPANSPFGPGQPGYLEDNGYPTFDLEEAKKLVKQYEAETGQPLQFSFLVNEDTTNIGIAQKFAATFEQAGIKVTLEPRPQINLLAAVALGGYQLSQFRVFAQPNPDADIHFYRTGSIGPVSLNFPRYANEAVDDAVDEAIGTTDEATRAKAYEKVNRIFADQVPMVWLGQNTSVVAANPRVNGIYKAANGSIPTVGPKTWMAELSISR